MPIHHLLSRATVLVLGLWASGGIFAVSFVTAQWAKYHNYRGAAPTAEHGANARVRSAFPIVFAHQSEPGLVSVVIPTHNRARILGRALQSALAQTYPSLEVVVADDGSSDDTRAVATSFGSRVRYARQPNAGVSAARNFGMRNARGEFIAFLDSDDAWHPWKIEAQVTALKRHPEAGLVWTDMTAVNEADAVIEPRYLRKMYSAYHDVDIGGVLNRVETLAALSPSADPAIAGAPVYRGDLSSAILLGNMIHTSTVLFRRVWSERAGGFDESYQRAGEDYEFYIRLSSVGPVIFIDAPSTLYRIGVADQLTAPAMMLEIARNNLRAIETWMPLPRNGVGLSPGVVGRRFSESFAWLGEAELEAGHRLMAARRLSTSLAITPGLDKRTLLLASCAFPTPVRNGVHAFRRRVAHTSGRPHDPFSSA